MHWPYFCYVQILSNSSFYILKWEAAAKQFRCALTNVPPYLILSVQTHNNFPYVLSFFFHINGSKYYYTGHSAPLLGLLLMCTALRISLLSGICPPPFFSRAALTFPQHSWSGASPSFWSSIYTVYLCICYDRVVTFRWPPCGPHGPLTTRTSPTTRTTRPLGPHGPPDPHDRPHATYVPARCLPVLPPYGLAARLDLATHNTRSCCLPLCPATWPVCFDHISTALSTFPPIFCVIDVENSVFLRVEILQLLWYVIRCTRITKAKKHSNK